MKDSQPKLFPVSRLTCHSQKRKGVINNFNDGCVPFRCASSRVLLHFGSLARLTGAFKWSRAIVSVISYTCASLSSRGGAFILTLPGLHDTKTPCVSSDCWLSSGKEVQIFSLIKQSDSLPSETIQQGDVRLKQMRKL